MRAQGGAVDDAEAAADLDPVAAGPWLPDEVDDRSRLVTLPLGRVFVCDVGPADPSAITAPPIVLVHGLFVTHHVFARIIPLLAKSRRVIALDLPGAGDSDHPAPAVADDYSVAWLAEAVLQTADAVGVDRFDVLGHDFGGAVALALAARYGGRIGKLHLLDPVALTVSLPLTGTLSIVPSLGSRMFERTLRRADLRGFLLQGLSAAELLCEPDVNVFWDRLGRRGARAATFAMLSQLPSLVRLRDTIRSVEVPTQVIWGDRDAIVGVEQGERLLALLGQGTLERVEGCGHNPADERPALVVRLIRGD